MKQKAFFITFEGGEGGGKTTQINKLSQFLTDKGLKVITTREPGGTPEAEKVRELIVQRGGGGWSPLAEALLLCAARTMHVENHIKPQLENNKIIICDRFADSTLAYQGYGHGLPVETIEDLNQMVLGDLKPDLTIILDVDPAAGIKRSGRRLAAEDLDIEQREDRFENLDLSFHERLRNGYLAIAAKHTDRCVVVDGMQDIEAIAKQVEDIVAERLG